jgi:hypothetical protein
MKRRFSDWLSLVALEVAWAGTTFAPAAFGMEPARGETPKPTGRSVSGLAFSLKADKYETFCEPDSNKVDPIRFQYVFKNVGDEPIRLDVWYPVTSAMRFHVVDPAGKRHEFDLFIPYKKREARTEADFITLMPGEAYKLDREIHIPFPSGGKRPDNAPRKQSGPRWTYSIDAPGQYRIWATFRRPEETAAHKGAKIWSGAVTSNEIVLVVRQRKRS